MVQMIYVCPLTNSPVSAASSANSRVVILNTAAKKLNIELVDTLVSNVVPVTDTRTTYFVTITLTFNNFEDADKFRDYVNESVGLTM